MGIYRFYFSETPVTEEDPYQREVLLFRAYILVDYQKYVCYLKQIYLYCMLIPSYLSNIVEKCVENKMNIYGVANRKF